MKFFYTIFKIGFILITAFLVISIFLVMNNKYNFPLLKEKNKIDTIYTKIINNEININEYTKSKYIKNQVLATTQPSLSIFYKFIRINKIFKKINDLFFYEKNEPYFANSLGGIILYDYNIAQANKYGGLEKYIKIISKSYSLRILFIDSINKKKILATIKPLILTDFDYPMIEKKKITYSRLTNGFDSVLNNKEDVIKKYYTANISSFLGPNVDYNNIDSNYKSKIDSLIILSKKYSFIPCLKHFCYDNKKGNTHFSESINHKSYNKILSEDLKPYFYLSSVINKNYLIMVGHHKIQEIDNINVASQSEKINLLISKELKNSVTISDEIGMRASSKGNMFFQAFPNYGFIKNIKTDILLAQGGNIFDHRKLILDEINKINNNLIYSKCLKILNLKKDYNLIELTYVK